MMEIRNASFEDLEKLTQIGCESFPTGYNYEDRLRMLRQHSRRLLERDVLVGEVAGEIVITLSAIPFRIWLGGVSMPMVGIAGVANVLEARRKGYASELCIAAIRRAREEGIPISILYPFRFDFYRKLGWGTIGELIEYNFHPRQLPKFPSREQVRRFHSNDLEELASCYQRFVETHNCLAERPPAVWQYWQERLNQRHFIAMVYESAGKITGYVTFSVEVDGGMLNQVGVVEELIYLDRSAYHGLWGFLGSLGDQFSTIRYWANPDEAFHHLLDDPRDTQKPILAGLVSRAGQYGLSYMLRILNVAQALALRSQYNGVTATFYLQIIDNQILENQAVYCLKLVEGNPQVTEIKEDVSIKITLSIDIFSQIYSGALTLAQATFLGLVAPLDNSVVEYFDQAFHQQRPFLLDQF